MPMNTPDFTSEDVVALHRGSEQVLTAHFFETAG